MDKFLKIEGAKDLWWIDNLNIAIFIRNRTYSLKQFEKKISSPDNFNDIFYQTYRKYISFSQIQVRRTHCDSFYEASIPLIPNREKHYNKTKLRINSFNKYRHKTLNKVLANWFQQYLKRNYISWASRCYSKKKQGLSKQVHHFLKSVNVNYLPPG